MHSLKIDHMSFMMAFERDVDYSLGSPQISYLDLKTGEILWIYVDDWDADMEAGIPEEENQALRMKVESSPNDYLEIPGLTHDEHHKILREFLNSDWTDNEELKNSVQEVYYNVGCSIGRWRKIILESYNSYEIPNTFEKYKETCIEQMAIEFLAENGIEPMWR